MKVINIGVVRSEADVNECKGGLMCNHLSFNHNGMIKVRALLTSVIFHLSTMKHRLPGFAVQFCTARDSSHSKRARPALPLTIPLPYK